MKKIGIIGSLIFTELVTGKLLMVGVKITLLIAQKDARHNSDYKNLENFCRDNGIKHISTENINSSFVLEEIKSQELDLLICLGWSRLIGEEIINSVPMGVWGYHPSLLPQNRGRHPLIWAIVLGLSKTGSTFFLMDKGFDTGKIIDQKTVHILPDERVWDLYNRVAKVSAAQLKTLLEKTNLKNIQDKNPETPVPNEGNFWRKRTENDGRIDFRMSSKQIFDLIRALSFPYPGAHFQFGSKKVKVFEAQYFQVAGYENIEPGKIINFEKNKSVTVKCGIGFITLYLDNKEIQHHLKKGAYI